MAREVQEQEVVGPAVGEEFLDVLPDDVLGLVEQRAHVEIADLGIPEHPGQRFGIVGRGAQPAKPRARYS